MKNAIKDIIDYHHVARCNVVRCIKALREYNKLKFQNDSLLIELKELTIKELKFFYQNRFNLQNIKTNGFGKYIA